MDWEIWDWILVIRKLDKLICNKTEKAFNLIGCAMNYKYNYWDDLKKVLVIGTKITFVAILAIQSCNKVTLLGHEL